MWAVQDVKCKEISVPICSPFKGSATFVNVALPDLFDLHVGFLKILTVILTVIL